jgi:hypothetical protein
MPVSTSVYSFVMPDAMIWSLPQPLVDSALATPDWWDQEETFSYRMQGAGTLVWGDQFCWVGNRGVKNLLQLQSRLVQLPAIEEGSVAGFMEAFVKESAEYAELLRVAAACAGHELDFSEYMAQIQDLATAFDQQRTPMSRGELDALYDDDFFAFMVFQKKSP